jgi:hypothetical protein
MRFLIGLLVAFLLPSASFAQNLKASNPQAIAERIRSLGYKADLQKDSDGDPVINSSTDGAPFAVMFYDCEKGINCETVVFYKGYTLEKEKYPKVRQLTDEWNSALYFSKAFIDEDSLHQSFNLLMKNEGIGPELFDSNFATWVSEYVDLRRKISEMYR